MRALQGNSRFLLNLKIQPVFKGFAELGQPVPNRAPGRVKKLVANPINSMFGGKTRGRQDLDAGEPLT